MEEEAGEAFNGAELSEVEWAPRRRCAVASAVSAENSRSDRWGDLTWGFAEEMIIDLSPQMLRLRLHATKQNFSVCSMSFVVKDDMIYL